MRCSPFCRPALLTRSSVLGGESQAGLAESLTLITRIHVASAPFCMASQGDYLEASTLSLCFLLDFLSLVGAAFSHRRDWIAELYVPGASSAPPDSLLLETRLPLLTCEVSLSSLALAASPAPPPAATDEEMAIALRLADPIVLK